MTSLQPLYKRSEDVIPKYNFECCIPVCGGDCGLKYDRNKGVNMKITLFFLILVLASANTLPSPENDQRNIEKTKSETETIAETARNARYSKEKFSSKYDKQKNDVSQFLSTKNIIHTIVKLFFGSNDESAATSRQILNILVSLLDMLQSTFSQRARARGLQGTMGDAGLAGAIMLQGYVKSILTKDEQCMQRYLCEASKKAVGESKEIGYLMAQIGGYAASYALENQKATPFEDSYNASRKGRSGEDCYTTYQDCTEEP
ncbi:uncharacterized protein LOC106471756 [Limulus polyphemus]|uniref:Uncharacterized protein LOC106471756 n=1 Tax=Limulus polyphemus TaxID=6850 RepID=A0ABM1BSJ3_LIMPO|nr:uncharacterized protein LOC106471756 [Limulus polyphemus]